MENLKKQIEKLLSTENLSEKVNLINELREFIHEYSPFKNEPVDFVKWIPAENVTANDYNPNKVAPPEMELLEISIMNDGYTQPVVTFPKENNMVEVVDGFHRTRVSKESKIVRERVLGYTPTVIIRKEQQGKNDRIASTIRHNRARGKHQIDAMSEIILELKNRNWKNERIARELGMDEEEILRLCQITGLQDIFKDDDFSKSWESSDSISLYEPLTDNLTEEEIHFRTVNTNDPDRIFHTFEKWECHKAGFYASKKEGMTEKQCEEEYALFLSDNYRFSSALEGVITEWKYSCEHYLTNKAMNRIAWLGQASVCYAMGIPSKYCAGFNLLSPEQQDKANLLALDYLNIWMKNNNRNEISLEEALSIGRQVNIY
jgi:ParB-like chromosome segregation protein Spo0J